MSRLSFPDTSDPIELLQWAARFTPRVALTCSFGGPGGLALAHMIHRHALKIPLLFIDTGFLFPETYALRDLFAQRYDLTIDVIQSTMSPEEQETHFGPHLWQRDPHLCCQLRKVTPMQHALMQLDAWVCALRRDQAPTRGGVETVEDHRLPNGRRICKINPLAHWTAAQVWEYLHRHAIPYNPLCDQGYRSIGCIHCTRPSGVHESLRAGRWSGSNKTECGLHTFTDKLEAPAQKG